MIKTAKQNIEDKLAAARLALAEAEAEHEQMLELQTILSPERQLALDLHALLCTANHTDGCSFLYYKPENAQTWEQTEYFRWEERARNILKIVDAPTAVRVLQAARAY